MLANSQNIVVNDSRMTNVGRDYNQNVYINTEEILGKFKKWLDPPDPSINHNNARNKHLKNTGQWLLKDERYLTWKQQPNSLMWINGISGCGKTLICSTVIENIKDIQAQPETGLAYFYFDIGDRTKQTTRGLLSHLVLALTARSKKYCIMGRLYEKHGRLYNPTWDELLGLLKELLIHFKQNYVVIDALDECDEYEQLFTKVITIIHGWQLSNVHLLMTSRREHHILVNMQECATVEICLSAELVGSDIISYIHAAVEANSKFNMWSHRVKEHVKEVLISGANGMFRWVACQIQELKLCPTPNKLMKALKSLPKSLEATYDQILQRIDPEYMPYVKTFLQWLVFGMRPLTTEELAVVVTFDPSRGIFDSDLALFHHDYVICLCSSLVTKTEYNTVRLAHASVKEYFLAGKSMLWEGDIALLETGTAHCMIAHCCVKYLLQDEWYDAVKDSDFPLLDYACQYWPNHYKLSKEDSTLDATIITFFEMKDKAFNQWTFMNSGTWHLYTFYEIKLQLHYAALFGLENVVKKLIMNAKSLEEYSIAVQIAAKEGNAGIVKLLLDTALNDINAVDCDDQSQLVSDEGPIGIMKHLLDRVLNNQYTERYGNALIASSHNGSAEIVKILVKNGADVNAQGGQYGSAIQAASYKGSTEIVKTLLENGADVNAQVGLYGNALQAACYEGSTEIVKVLLENGVDVNAQGGEYGNALQAASYNGSTEIVRTLLENGVDMNVQGGKYGNALQAASYKGSSEVVRILLEHGADVSAQGGEYGSALQAASYKGSGEVVKILLDHGADVNAQGGIYGNALQAASYNGSTQIVKVLLENGADVNAHGGTHDNALQAASFIGFSEIVKILLGNGADVNVQGGRYGNALQAASHKGSTNVVKTLLENGVDVNAHGGEYGNALQAASYMGSSDVVQILLDNGVDVNVQGGKYGNALQAASYKGSSEVVKILLDHGADVNAQGETYGNALQAASYKGSCEVVKILLENGANVNAQGGIYGNALQTVSYMGASEIVKILLDHGADMNAQGGAYGNALQAASYNGSSEVVKILLDCGADVNAQGGIYGNALQAASYKGSSEIVKTLVENGIDVNVQGGEYSNALQAASYRGSREVVKILLDHGADVNAQGGTFGNALQAAAYKGSSEVVKILLDHGANVNAQGGRYGNALQAASYKGSSEIVKTLVENGVDVNVQGGEYSNALLAASYRGSREVVKILLDHGADVNAQGGTFGNALQAASCKGSTEIVKILLENGVDLNVQGGEYGSALQAASYMGCSEVVKILLDHGANVNAQGGRYGNALQAAAYKGSSEVVNILLYHGANVNAQAGRYGNALQAAAYKGSSAVVNILLDRGANVNAQGGRYGNILQAAAYKGSSEVVKILVDHGANVNAQGGRYGNALQTASYMGSTEVVKILLDHGANVNSQGGRYGNALQAAAYKCFTEIVKTLMENGIDVNAQGGEYGNALYAASYMGSSEVVNSLLDHGADVNAQGGKYGNVLLAAVYEGHAQVVKLLLSKRADVHSLTQALYIAKFRGDIATVNVLLDMGANLSTTSSLPSHAFPWVFPHDIDIYSVPSEFRTSDTEWWAVFNPIIKRVLDVQLVHNLIHNGPASCIRFSMDGRYLATAFSKTTQMYDIKTGVVTCVLVDKLAKGNISSICFSPDNKLLATGTDSLDKKIRVWDIAEQHILFVFDEHQEGICSLNFSFDGHLLVSGSMDGMVKIWDVINAGAPCKVLAKTNPGTLNVQPLLTPVSFSPNQQFVAAASDDATICLWEATTGAPVEQLLWHQNPVCTIVFMPDGKRLVSGDYGGTVKYWDVSKFLGGSNGRKDNEHEHAQSDNSEASGIIEREEEQNNCCTMTCTAHGDQDVAVVVSHDGQWVMSCPVGSNVVQLWDAKSGEVLLMLRTHTNFDPISSFEFCPTGGLIATGSHEGKVMIWSYGLVQDV